MSTTVQSKVDKLFPPSEFNESPVSNLLLTKKIFLVSDQIQFIVHLMNYFRTFNKLSDNNVKNMYQMYLINR